MNTFRVSSNTQAPVKPMTPNDWVQAYTIEGNHEWSEFSGGGFAVGLAADLYEALREGSTGNGKPFCLVNVKIDGCNYHIVFNLMNRTYSDGDYLVLSRLIDDSGIIREFSLNFSNDRVMVTIHLENQ